MDDEPKKSSLFGSMMKAIRTRHTWGNRLGFVKLPLILTDVRLYGGAIAQFYFLTATLEGALSRRRDDPLVDSVLSQGLNLAPGYQADLAQIFGDEWHAAAARARTPATEAYCKQLEAADSVELVAAAFIL
jgi:heme oxygenase